jgi:hypothetical protein
MGGPYNSMAKIGKVNNNNRFKRDSTGDDRKVGSLIKVRAVFSRSSYACRVPGCDIS